jgi:hypothetical protein
MNKFSEDFNRWLKSNKQKSISIGHPLGSTAWHKQDADDKIYGDIDLQMIADTGPANKSPAQLAAYMNTLVGKFISEVKPGYIFDHGKTSSGHIIINIGIDAYVQVDLIWTEAKLAPWQRYRLTPAQNIKGAAYGNLFSTLGEIMNMSIQTAGAQMKIKAGLPVDFAKNRTVDKVETLTIDIHNFGTDLLKKLNERIHPNSNIKIDPELAAYPGIDPDQITVEHLVSTIRGLAKSFSENSMYGHYNLRHIQSYDDFIAKFKEHYLAKMVVAASSTKFNKAATPEAIAKAEETKNKLLTHAQKIMALL